MPAHFTFETTGTAARSSKPARGNDQNDHELACAPSTSMTSSTFRAALPGSGPTGIWATVATFPIGTFTGVVFAAMVSPSATSFHDSGAWTRSFSP